MQDQGDRQPPFRRQLQKPYSFAGFMLTLLGIKAVIAKEDDCGTGTGIRNRRGKTVTANESPRKECDGEEKDRVGVCLDIDGTVYRSGSVFVETLGFLPYADGVSMDETDKRHLRTALAAVAEFHGGTLGKLKWMGVLTLLDVLRANGANRFSESVLTSLIEHRTEQSPGQAEQWSRGQSRRTELRRVSGDYRSMQRTVLASYGRFLRGKHRSAVERAVDEIVDEQCRIEPRLEVLLDGITTNPVTELVLITDMPEHVASAYARKLEPEVTVKGTSFETDAEGRYTGQFAGIDKEATVARLRTDRRWTHVIAAGDSSVDLEMASEADIFLAVAGQGDLASHFEGEVTALRRGNASASLESGSGENVVWVGRDERFAAALRTVLATHGDFPNL